MPVHLGAAMGIEVENLAIAAVTMASCVVAMLVIIAGDRRVTDTDSSDMTASPRASADMRTAASPREA